MTALDEAFAGMRPDESSTSGYDDMHVASLPYGTNDRNRVKTSTPEHKC